MIRLLLAAALGTPHVVFVEAEREQCFFGNCAFGNAILSRRPILDAGHVIARPAPGDILLGEQPRDSVEARAAVWASIGIGDERVGVCAAHLDHKADPLREKQLTLFLDELKRNAPALHLICGDLNAFLYGGGRGRGRPRGGGRRVARGVGGLSGIVFGLCTIIM